MPISFLYVGCQSLHYVPLGVGWVLKNGLMFFLTHLFLTVSLLSLLKWTLLLIFSFLLKWFRLIPTRNHGWLHVLRTSFFSANKPFLQVTTAYGDSWEIKWPGPLPAANSPIILTKSLVSNRLIPAADGGISSNCMASLHLILISLSLIMDLFSLIHFYLIF